MTSEHKYTLTDSFISMHTQAQTKSGAQNCTDKCILKYINKPTFICYAGSVTEAAAMTEGFNGGILITERLHISVLPPWKKR